MYDLIKLAADGLQNDRSIRIVCPFCVTDTANKQSLRITRSGNITRFKCFRACCGVGGKLLGSGMELTTDCQPTKPESNPYTLPSRMLLGFDLYNELQDRGLCHADTADVMASRSWSGISLTEDNGLLFACQGLNNRRVGHVWRAAGKKRYATYKAVVDEPFCHYVGNFNPIAKTNKSTIVVVEDWLSAEAVYAALPSMRVKVVALAGAFMSNELLALSAKTGSHLIMALDPGAEVASYKVLRRAIGLFESVKVVALKQDPKNMSQYDIEATFEPYIGEAHVA